MSGLCQTVIDDDATFHVTILRSKSTGQIIYLEAGKDLVDVLLSFLVLPVGTIIRMLNAAGVRDRKFGAMDNIYKSVEKLPDLSVYQSLLTDPRPGRDALRGSAVLTFVADPPITYTLCLICQFTISESSTFRCPRCCIDVGRNVRSVNYFRATYPTDGYSKEGVAYIVGNNLEIMPTSTINTMDILSKTKVMNLSELLSIDKKISRKDVLNILVAAISGSETALSDWFMSTCS